MRRLCVCLLMALVCCGFFALGASAQQVQRSGMVYQAQDAIFYVADGVYRMDLDGSNDVRIADPTVCEIAGSGDSLFYVCTPMGTDLPDTLYHHRISTGETRALCSVDRASMVTAASEDAAYVGRMYRVDLDGNIERLGEFWDPPEGTEEFWSWGLQDIRLDGKRFFLQKDALGSEWDWGLGEDEDEGTPAIRLCVEQNGVQRQVWEYAVSPEDLVFYEEEVKLFEYGGMLYVQFPLNRGGRFAAYNIIYAIDPDTYEALKVVDAHCDDYGGLGYYVEFVPVGDWGFVYLSGDGEWNTIAYATKFKLADLIGGARNAQSLPKQHGLHGQELVHRAGDAIYYVDGGLRRMDADGSNEVRISGFSVRHFVPAGDWLYFVDAGTLCRYGMSDGRVQTLWTCDGDSTLWAAGEDCAFVGQHFLRFADGRAQATFFGEAASMQRELQGITSEPFRQWGTQDVLLGGAHYSLIADEPDAGYGVKGIGVYAEKDGERRRIWEFTRDDGNGASHGSRVIVYDPLLLKLFDYGGTLFVQFPLNSYPEAGHSLIYEIDPQTHQATKLADVDYGRALYGGDIEFYVAGDWGFVYLVDEDDRGKRRLAEKIWLVDTLKKSP